MPSKTTGQRRKAKAQKGEIQAEMPEAHRKSEFMEALLMQCLFAFLIIVFSFLLIVVQGKDEQMVVTLAFAWVTTLALMLVNAFRMY